MSISSHHPTVLAHAVIAGVGVVHQPALQPIEDHVLFDSAQQVDGTLLTAAFPVIEVDACLIIDNQDALSFGHSLAQALGLDSFERAHVMLMQSFRSEEHTSELQSRFGISY